jgi:2-C-methyl-D-erythritol 4-phosphate cytidylyltransferase/2-C-methyl-D-erythritol 2,4-cyclodiphosphate synthase
MTGCIALVVAAGRGSRLGGGVSKQYRNLGGRPVLLASSAVVAWHAATG